MFFVLLYFLSLQAFCFVGVVVISYAAAFIVSVSVEFPMMQLEKLIFKNIWALKFHSYCICIAFTVVYTE